MFNAWNRRDAQTCLAAQSFNLLAASLVYADGESKQPRRRQTISRSGRHPLARHFSRRDDLGRGTASANRPRSSGLEQAFQQQPHLPHFGGMVDVVHLRDVYDQSAVVVELWPIA